MPYDSVTPFLVLAALLAQSGALVVFHGHQSLIKPANDTAKLVSSNRSRHSAEVTCTPQTTVFDLGFYDGGDARTYFTHGYCVVGVEADPDLVATGNQAFHPQVTSGQLQLLNLVVAPEGAASSWTVFYKSKCTKEWNSFYKSIGCRSCAPPHLQDDNACIPVQVTAADCSSIFSQYGVPLYLKLDIEGAETGCFQAMGQLPQGTLPPQFVSAEITELKYIDTLHKLGYQGFKLVNQQKLNTVVTNSGPFGKWAEDCRTIHEWRTYEDIRKEFSSVLTKAHDPADPCPGGLMPIHGKPGPDWEGPKVWYDIHAVLTWPAAGQ